MLPTAVERKHTAAATCKALLCSTREARRAEHAHAPGPGAPALTALPGGRARRPPPRPGGAAPARPRPSPPRRPPSAAPAAGGPRRQDACTALRCSAAPRAPQRSPAHAPARRCSAAPRTPQRLDGGRPRRRVTHLAQDAPAQQAEVRAHGRLEAGRRRAQRAVDGEAQREQRQLRVVAPAGLVALARAPHALHLRPPARASAPRPAKPCACHMQAGCSRRPRLHKPC